MSGRVVDPRVAKPVSGPSVAMPLPVTELSELLADDATICIRRPVKPCRAEAQSSAVASVAKPVLAAIPCDDEAELGPELTRVVEAWPALSRSAHRAILAMIDAVLS